MNNMLDLPNVTLVAMTSVQIPETIKALRKSSKHIKFGAIKLLSHSFPKIQYTAKGKSEITFEYVPKMSSIDEWNKAIIYELRHHIDTSHAILIHADGYIINSHLWKDEWLQYDFAGSPWPFLPEDDGFAYDYSYRNESGKRERVGNSVGLRSKKLMDLVATRPWREYHGNTNEDGFICCHNREWLEAQGCNFMPFEEAIHFGKEHTFPENKDLETFLFHSIK